MKKKNAEKDQRPFPPIAIDTREQNALRFPAEIATEVRTLKTGDYSLVGFESSVAIERKSKADAYGSLGADRERFERELVRMSDLDFSAIVVESSLMDFLEPPTFSRMSPRAALRTLIAWSVKYRVPVYWGDDRRHCAALVVSLLEFWWKYFGSKMLLLEAVTQAGTKGSEQ